MNKNIVMILVVVALAILPLVIHHNGDAEFGGADGQAEVLITEIHPDYQPWFNAIWEPPSGEIESLLFALQAALGAGLVGFYFGRRSVASRNQEPAPPVLAEHAQH
jgi:cobalt/nickel transport protein